jgi:hypothetical protein
VQALYFDRKYHTITSAQLWWDRHKYLVDIREQLTHFLKWRSQAFMARISLQLQRIPRPHRRSHVAYAPDGKETGGELHPALRKDTE